MYQPIPTTEIRSDSTGVVVRQSSVDLVSRKRFWYNVIFFLAFAIIGLLTAQAILWFVGSGRAHNCVREDNPLPALELTACNALTDNVCRKYHENEAAGTLAIAMAIFYLFYASWLYRVLCKDAPDSELSAPWWKREFLIHANDRNSYLTLAYLILHVPILFILFTIDRPDKVTARACGNTHATDIWFIIVGTVAALVLQLFVMWWYFSTCCPNRHALVYTPGEWDGVPLTPSRIRIEEEKGSVGGSDEAAEIEAGSNDRVVGKIVNFGGRRGVVMIDKRA